MNRIVLTLFVAAVLTGCTGEPTVTSRPADFVVIGVDPDQPPFALLDSTGETCVGFDVDLLSVICLANRWRCEFRPMAIDSLDDALTRGDIDIAVGEFSTAVEGDQIAQSDPYYLTGLVMIVASAHPLPGVEASWQGKLVVVPRQVPGNALAFALKDAQVRAYDNPNDIVVELEAGRIAAMVADYTTARKLVADHPGLHIVPGMLTTTYYTAALRAADTLHMTRLNNALAALLGGYTYEQLHMKWFGYPLLNVAVPDSVSARWNKR